MNKFIITIVLVFAIAVPLSIALAQSTNAPSSKPPSPAVRDVAAHPSAYVGQLALTGVVGIVNPGKGFVLVDMKEYQNEGFNCLATDEPTKISVRWTGTAPKVREKVCVKGRLAKEKTGYAFTAKKVEKQ
ncbi:MAG: hypothetical protein KGR98_06725 [Verrucomicrobia bacterium]|nr:hypothetical protein [Verrucomicrobiota bacterium]